MALLLAFLLPAFLLGLLFGSFLNVCIARLPDDGSIVSPRSQCPACRHPIRAWDNIPLLSFLLLRARCRDCQARISWQYPLVEAATGAWFAVVAYRVLRLPAVRTHVPLSIDGTISLGITTVSLATLGFLLLGLLVIDWQRQLLPDMLNLPGILLGLLFTCGQAALLPTGAYDLHFNPRRSMRLRSPGSFIARGDVFLTGTERLVYGRVAAVLGAALLLLLLRWIYRAVRHREGMGLGDAKLLALLAAFLGFWPAMLSLFLGVLAASVFAIALLATGRAHRTTRLPFGSFLAAGGLLAALFADPVLAWYKTLL